MCQIFSCPAVSVFSVFPQKTVYMSSPTMEVAENAPSKSFRVFKTVGLMYVVQILNMTFTLLPLLTLLPSSFRAFKHVCSFNILQSAISECRPLIICSLNSSTLHMGVRSLLKQLCACECQPGYSYHIFLDCPAVESVILVSDQLTEVSRHSTAVVSPSVCKLLLVVALSVSMRVVESFRMEKTFKIIESNH